MRTPFRAKCCGITRLADGVAAAQSGFDAVGLVFAARSKRCLTHSEAAGLRRALPTSLKVVALCMDNPVDEVRSVIEKVQPDFLQFHGREPQGFCNQFDRPWIKAIAMGEGKGALSELERYPQAAALLLDGTARDQLGGEGMRFDWSLAVGRLNRPWILAGGLHADNVARAVRQTRPWGVDVSSGVESSPGYKDAARMERFAAAVEQCANDFAEPAPD